MTGFLILLHAIVSLLLITVILMQASQGGGLSGTIAGQATSSILGGQGAATALSRITTWLGGLFLVLAVVISMISGPAESSGSSLIKQEADNAPTAVQGTELEIPTVDPTLESPSDQ
ncbi:MAG: preprotein translocase subunit SecG [Candidatus Marinimicrobia bacterium]|jgi:preprotein translocase subunit SecG|nr:preprotein translocase subunit SecG [Candidatus Neomarinimicrobiota bacterium]MBT3937524.1 preprotein translocase subunit SecG [Candidatus Neomarinimicrobiota bacterium]MBT3961144.1 preprotein translocase subunit SecG [Candidatus Neomarinimicrobiota bacterium]MBT4384027.1 preprotein translocase subunit SecG [Candidatus Neomarinimicrobiota bacterium]MBT4636982.1 preprotein translocase subunit SecG [Candidatus Neomarinimicrobiota bacterium]